jgi:hypothetical protein
MNDTPQARTLLFRTRAILAFFMVALVASGLTAIPLEWELDVLARALGIAEGTSPDGYSGLTHWIATVRQGLHETYARYPFVAYGTDWLAFAHVVLGILFIGPLVDPVRNRWVITFSMIACGLVVPWALVFSYMRGIPLFWSLIDCSFGVLGVIPLALARRYTDKLAVLGRDRV